MQQPAFQNESIGIRYMAFANGSAWQEPYSRFYGAADSQCIRLPLGRVSGVEICEFNQNSVEVTHLFSQQTSRWLRSYSNSRRATGQAD